MPAGGLVTSSLPLRIQTVYIGGDKYAFAYNHDDHAKNSDSAVASP